MMGRYVKTGMKGLGVLFQFPLSPAKKSKSEGTIRELCSDKKERNGWDIRFNPSTVWLGFPRAPVFGQMEGKGNPGSLSP